MYGVSLGTGFAVTEIPEEFSGVPAGYIGECGGSGVNKERVRMQGEARYDRLCAADDGRAGRAAAVGV